MCADNGVYDECVSSCPKSVTSSVTQNFAKVFTGINAFSRLTNAYYVIVDIGIDDDIEHPMILNKKMRKGWLPHLQE